MLTWNLCFLPSISNSTDHYASVSLCFFFFFFLSRVTCCWRNTLSAVLRAAGNQGANSLVLNSSSYMGRHCLLGVEIRDEKTWLVTSCYIFNWRNTLTSHCPKSLGLLDIYCVPGHVLDILKNTKQVNRPWFPWHLHYLLGFPSGSVVKNSPAMQEPQEMWVSSLGQEDPLEESMATHSSILAWRIPWTEEPGRLRSRGSQSRTWLKQPSTHTFYCPLSVHLTNFCWLWVICFSWRVTEILRLGSDGSHISWG